ncbi:MAG TPA: DUF3574 domain-containing protein [Chitinophagaceae bacterium]|jgi:hypothetical protein|nr:DUF3574 domain-containing protein [Chitinophagaceae bacterium]
MRYRLFLIGLIIIVSCSPQRMMETNLYFGQSKPSGEMVTETEWNQFKENYISKVFKEGSTVINVSGNWYDPDNHKLITEPTYKVIYFYKPSEKISRQIDSLRYWYKTLFQQQSVLRVDRKVKASF